MADVRMFRRDSERDRGERRDWNDWRFFGLAPYVVPIPVPYAVPYGRFNIPSFGNGWAGPGIYRVMAPNGLNARVAANSGSLIVQTLPFGANVSVLSQDVDGWVRVRLDSGRGAYVCMNCSEAPGGPWLTRVSGGVVTGAEVFDQPIVFNAPLGFRSKNVHAHHKRRIRSVACTAYQPSGLFIPRRVARHFDVCSLRIGSFYLPLDHVPAEIFECGGTDFLLPPIGPGQRVYLTVKNRSNRSHHFRAALNGSLLL